MKPKTWYKNLSEFIEVLKAEGEVKVISKQVSVHLEISRLTDAESKSPGGGKALYFENVEGSAFPVATNLFGSDRRICLALGVTDLDQLGNRIRDLVHMSPPSGLKEMVGLLPTVLGLTRYFPRNAKSGTPPCQENVFKGDRVDLTRLPVLQCWPKDAGPFVTLPLVFTKSLKTGKRNVGMYRLQIFDRNTTGMHWHIHKDGSHYYNEYRDAKKRMPVAVAIGCDPASIYAATAPMPRDVDELILAGFIRNKPVPMAQCLTIDMKVPAEAEFVLEGYVEPGELRREGPFGDHTGFYSLADDYPVFHVTALTHRHSPVYSATLVGPPPMEDCYLAKATERLFLPLLQTVFPEIQDYWLPWEGVFHNLVIVSLKKEYPGHAVKVINGLWGQGQMSFSKAIVMVDHRVDLTRPEEIMRALLSRLDLNSDLVYSKGILDVLDHSSPTPVFGSKIGVDLTPRAKGEPARDIDVNLPASDPPSEDTLLEQLQEQMENILHLRSFPGPGDTGYHFSIRNRILCLGVQKGEDETGQMLAEKLLNLKGLDHFNIIIFYDPDVDIKDASVLLWKLFNNVDPERDMHRGRNKIVIDAGIKGPRDGHTRKWPEELTFDVE